MSLWILIRDENISVKEKIYLKLLKPKREMHLDSVQTPLMLLLLLFAHKHSSLLTEYSSQQKVEVAIIMHLWKAFQVHKLLLFVWKTLF